MGHFNNAAWAFAAVGLMSAAGAVNANSIPIQWSTGTDANGNYYQRIDTGNASTLTFQDTQADAAAMTVVEAGTTYRGELAILNGDLSQYDAAFTFIHDNVMYPLGTLAGNDQGYWVGATIPASTTSGAAGATWIDGSMVPTDVTSTWNVDHFEGAGLEGVNYFQPGSSQLWDYTASDNSHLAFGYVVEFVPVAVPTPAAFGGGILLLAGLGLKKATKRTSSPA